MPIAQNTQFGKYQILDLLAIGGMAEVYRARVTGAEGFEKIVVIKRIHAHLAAEKDLISSFIDEAKLAALLQHQNIVMIHDFGNVDGSYYIAMEYLHGRDLSRIIERGRDMSFPLRLEHILQIVSRICAGLDYAHNLKDANAVPLNIIHRDVSPQNILVTYEGNVKILDFGIAKAVGKCTQTQTGVIKGKVAYMSPEQARGMPVDHRSDIFATGILLYEMVTGQRMYLGQDTIQLLQKVSVADFVPAEKIVENLPPLLYEILRKALARDPDQRYQTDAAMLADIEECAYQSGLRLSTRGLSQYMKQIFADEIEAEKAAAGGTGFGLDQRTTGFSAMEEATQVPMESAAVRDPAAPQEEEPAPAVKPQRRGWVAAAAWGALVLAVLVACLYIIFKKPGVESLQTQAVELLDKKKFAQSAALFEQILDRDPAALSRIADPYGQALQGQAQAIAKQDPTQAKALLLEAVKVNPASANLFFDLGALLAELKDYSGAISAYEKSAAIDPSSPETFFNLAYIYAIGSSYDKAEAAYKRVVELAPPYIDEALFNLAVVQDRQGKKAKCRENLKRALRANPKNDAAKKYLAKMR